jgi:hypothetical protein
MTFRREGFFGRAALLNAGCFVLGYALCAATWLVRPTMPAEMKIVADSRLAESH